MVSNTILWPELSRLKRVSASSLKLSSFPFVTVSAVTSDSRNIGSDSNAAKAFFVSVRRTPSSFARFDLRGWDWIVSLRGGVRCVYVSVGAAGFQTSGSSSLMRDCGWVGILLSRSRR